MSAFGTKQTFQSCCRMNIQQIAGGQLVCISANALNRTPLAATVLFWVFVPTLAGLIEAAGEAELAAEDVRLAVRALGRITGRVDVEDILDVVFGDFCIGK
ncbi:MAG: hypothetical protein V7701_05390 [Sneathiella sp.]